MTVHITARRHSSTAPEPGRGRARRRFAPGPIVATVALLAATSLGAQAPAPEGKAATDRWLNAGVVVEATPSEVFEMWTTIEGVRRFFATDAEIELRPGGAYEIYFVRRDHPEVEINSTMGARLLELERDRRLSFEWNASPLAPELDTEPLPLWFTVEIEPLAGEAARTSVVVTGQGYGRGERWDAVYEFAFRGLTDILYGLDRALVDPAYRSPWIEPAR